MGEIVMEVVERVIGREVNAEAHHDLIDEAVAALRADTGRRRRRRRSRGPSVNPSLQGYTAAVGRGGRSGRARRRWRPTLKRSSSSCWPTPSCGRR